MKKIPLYATYLCMTALAACGEAPQDTTESTSSGEEGYEIIAILADFDSHHVNVETSSAETELVSSGDGKALKIELSPDSDWSAARLRPETPWDWSELTDYHFAIDVENVGTESAQLYIALTKATGDADVFIGNRAVTANRSSNVAAGSSATYFFVLDGPAVKMQNAKRENPAHWETDDIMMQWRFGQKHMKLDAVTEITLRSTEGEIARRRR